MQEIVVDGCITKAPGAGEFAGRNPADSGKQSMKRSSMTDGSDPISAGPSRAPR
jgi:hypothetical protein